MTLNQYPKWSWDVNDGWMVDGGQVVSLLVFQPEGHRFESFHYRSTSLLLDAVTFLRVMVPLKKNVNDIRFNLHHAVISLRRVFEIPLRNETFRRLFRISCPLPPCP